MQLTTTQAVEKFKNGERVIIGEYRHGKAETINYRDRETGKAATFTAVRHTVEIGNDAFIVSERVPDGFDTAKWTPPAAKGQRVLLSFTGFQVRGGIGTFYGTVQTLADK